jgi:hypothetical protein
MSKKHSVCVECRVDGRIYRGAQSSEIRLLAFQPASAVKYTNGMGAMPMGGADLVDFECKLYMWP